MFETHRPHPHLTTVSSAHRRISSFTLTASFLIAALPVFAGGALTHAQRLALRRQRADAHAAKVAAQHKALSSGNVVEAAYSLRGTRYRMGGTSRSGFDCSGFVRYILSHTGGVALPRTAMEQYENGAPVPRAQLQPGDLVFFKNTYRHGISHVGIYTGNGQFIHAANAHKGVRVDSLGSAYYAHHYAGGRRVLPAQMRQAALR